LAPALSNLIRSFLESTAGSQLAFVGSPREKMGVSLEEELTLRALARAIKVFGRSGSRKLA
jgi:hypothetical protein